jgi:hypothetical protein
MCFPGRETFCDRGWAHLSNAVANSPIAIGSWPATAISGAVVLVQQEEGLFVMFKSASTSLILLCVLAISYIRG